MKDKFLSESGLQISELPKGFVRHPVHQEYAAILEDHGLDYMIQSRNRMRKLAILWVAIIRHAREDKLVDGPLDDRYTLEDEGLDWGILLNSKFAGVSSDSLRVNLTVPRTWLRGFGPAPPLPVERHRLPLKRRGAGPSRSP